MNKSGESGVTEAREERRQDHENNEVSTGAVDIQPSETGDDPEVGHTPGKAEGVDAPEAEGNE